MKDIFELNRQMARLCWTMAQAQAEALTVIGFRMPGLVFSSTQAGPPSAETRRMVSEKVQAAQMGMTAATAAAVKLGAAKGPVALASAMLDVFEASGKPARTRVSANVRRLSKKTPSRG